MRVTKENLKTNPIIYEITIAIYYEQLLKYVITPQIDGQTDSSATFVTATGSIPKVQLCLQLSWLSK